MPNPGDLIGGFTDIPIAGDELQVRLAPIRGVDPQDDDPPEPLWGIYVCGVNTDPGWLTINAVPFDGIRGAQEDLALEENRVRFQRLSILIGASWNAVTASASTVAQAQEAAVVRLPPNVYTASLEELRRVRGMINNADPAVVTALLGMTYHWQTDPGGTNGAAHYA